jgi:hypothetical protein
VSLSDISHISNTRVGNTSAAPVQNYHQNYQNNVADSSSYQDYSKFQEEIGETFKQGKQSLDSMAMVYMQQNHQPTTFLSQNNNKNYSCSMSETSSMTADAKN